jgi:transcriptional regulator with XRE-family HTH domain
MIIGERLRSIREYKNMSQGEIEERTGLLRCYISRVENGHTVPAIETLEKMARALEMPLYEMLYDGDEPPKLPATDPSDKILWGSSGKDARYLRKLTHHLSKMEAADRQLILVLLEKMVQKKGRKRA